MRRMIPEKAQKYIKDLSKAHPDPTASWGGSGSDYTAGNGIDITEGEISVDYGTGLTVSDETLIIDTTTVALKSELFSGDYDDLTNKPDLSVYAESADLATVATTGAYSDLTGTPTIPAAQVQSDWSQSDNTQVDYIKNKPTIPAAVSGTNDGTNWTNLTIGSDTYAIPQGSTPSNMVTTDTAQTISGEKSFSNFRLLMTNNYARICEQSNSEKRAIWFNYGGPSVPYYGTIILGRPSPAGVNPERTNANTGIAFHVAEESWNGANSGLWYLDHKAFYYNPYSTETVNLGTSARPFNNLYINGSISDGTNSISISNIASTSDIPTTATSTSSVTPSTVQLTFTYSDNTTETITLMTGASVSTTTTLS